MVVIPKDSKSPLQRKQRLVHDVLKDCGDRSAPWGYLIPKELHRLGRAVRAWHSIRMESGGLGNAPAAEHRHRWKNARAFVIRGMLLAAAI